MFHKAVANSVIAGYSYSPLEDCGKPMESVISPEFRPLQATLQWLNIQNGAASGEEPRADSVVLNPPMEIWVEAAAPVQAYPRDSGGTNN